MKPAFDAEFGDSVVDCSPSISKASMDMQKRRIFLVWLLFCISGSALYSQASALKIEIRATKTEVKSGEGFSVSTIIRNTGSQDVVFGVLLCGYCYQWRADVPSVSVGADVCTNNALSRIRLKPGESYERPVVVFVSLNANTAESMPINISIGISKFGLPEHSTAPAYLERCGHRESHKINDLAPEPAYSRDSDRPSFPIQRSPKSTRFFGASAAARGVLSASTMGAAILK